MYLFEMIQQEGRVCSHPTTLCLLKSCINQKSLIHGRLINDHIIRNGQIFDVSIATSLINMYAKCGSTDEAQRMFDALSIKNVVTWNVLISGCILGGQNARALLLFERMKKQKEVIYPVKVTYLYILKACGGLIAVQKGNLIYHDIIKSGFDVDLMVGNCIIDFYAKCGLLQEARKVFTRLLIRDVVSWNSMISGFVQCGDASTAVKLFKEMQQEGCFPDIFSFSCAFRACGSMKTLDLGMSMHKQLVEVGLNIDEIVGGTLVDMYAKCGSLQEARHIFDGLRHRNNIVWGTMLSGYAIHGQYMVGIKLFNQMEDEGIFPDTATFPFILQCCVGIRDLSEGRVVHNIVLKRQWEVENTITNALIDMYAKCGSIEEAHKVFDHMLNQDMISWNTLIAGYVQHEDGFKALDLYERMREKRFISDKVTFLAGLKACADTGALLLGKILHDEVYRCGFESDVVLSSTLVNMYAKWGNLGDACSVFNTLSQYDVVSCGSMITGYIQHEQWLSAWKIYELMHQKNIKPDNISFACILKACSGLESVHVGEHIHDDVLRSGLDKDMLIGNALIDMYAKWGRLQDARYSFDKLLSRNLASWNAMMTGYAQFDDSSQTLLLFQRLQYEGMHPDQVSFVCALKACTNAGSIEHGRQIHDKVIRHSLECDLVISNSIIDMYAKCGNLEEANKIFDGLRHRDVVSWSALISGYAQDGSFEKVEYFLMKMKKTGLEPVSKTFTSVLGACSHTGKVKASHMYFKAMREEFKIIPSIEHYNCMIDVLGRAGHFDDACKFLQSFPMFPNVKTWMSLLTSCRTFGRISFGKHCFNELRKQDPNNASAFLIMSKIYADANMWDEVYKLEEARREKGAWKKPGKACLEIAAEVHEFITKDKGYHHPEVVCLG